MDPGTHGSNGASNVHMNPCPDGIQKSPHGIIILFILYETHYNNILFLLGVGGGHMMHQGSKRQYTQNLELASSYLRLAFSQKCFFESRVARAKVETSKRVLKRLLVGHTKAAQQVLIWGHEVGRVIAVEYNAP